jgi:tetratricopeptide (TPR) repeat protein/tRNA A-37 threonylcarbamoyl transferase component Bud32
MIGQTVSHYKILEQLGAGAMGVVYKAEDTRLERHVAIKFLPQHLSTDANAKKRFIHEAKAASSLDHPNICTIHEINETNDGQLYIVMACYEGSTLRELLERKPLKIEEALDIFLQIASGLSKAHQKDIVHRDIKPGNIIVTEDGQVKIVDFGLAKLAGRTKLTKTDGTVGTAAYMSPEQARGETSDHRTDIWALGVVLYEMITGKLPFYADHEQAAIYRIMNEEPAPLAILVSNLPNELERIVDRTLAKDPKERYQTIGELVEDIKRMVDKSSIPLMRPLPATARPVWRNFLASKVVWISMVAVAAAVVAGILFVPRPSVSFNERDWILITDFENLTGEDVFDRSLNTALTVSLQQSRHANVFPRSRVYEVLESMGKPKTEILDEVLGSDVAQRRSVQLLIVPSISRIGDVYSLSAKIVDPTNLVSLKTESVRAEGKEGILGALDDLAEKVRKDLGESLVSIVKRNVPLAHATTSSLEALKSFSEAHHAWINGRFDEAVRLWESAVALDSTFAWAHTSLGLYYYYTNNRPQGDFHYDRAMENLHRCTERERLWLSSMIESDRGKKDKAIEILKGYLSKYPDDSLARYNLGNYYRDSGANKEAINTYKKQLEVEPKHTGAHINVATCYARLGKVQEAIPYYEEAFRLQPEWLENPNLNHEYGFTLVDAGQYEKAEKILGMMAEKEDWREARGHRSLALLEMYRGQYANAVERLKEAALINESLKYWTSALRDRLFAASGYLMQGRTEQFYDELETADKLRQNGYHEPYYLQLLAKFFAREGKVERAIEIRDSIASIMNEARNDDLAAFNVTEGEVELARGRYEEAVRLFERAYQLREDDLMLESLAYALYKKGDLDQAITKYEQLIEVKSLGWEAQDCWIRSLVQLGNIWEKKGDQEKAARYYEEFLELWKEADRDIPLLVQTQNRLLALR